MSEFDQLIQSLIFGTGDEAEGCEVDGDGFRGTGRGEGVGEV